MRIYIAGPYTKGDVVLNVRSAVHAAAEVYANGHEYYIPHLSHLEHAILPRPYEYWLKHDMAWLEVCDAVLRLPGESKGADAEVARAIELGIPVYYSIEDIPFA
jgi:hypothetical protein